MTIRQIPILNIPFPALSKKLLVSFAAITLIVRYGRIIITSINIFKEGFKAFKEEIKEEYKARKARIKKENAERTILILEEKSIREELNKELYKTEEELRIKDEEATYKEIEREKLRIEILRMEEKIALARTQKPLEKGFKRLLKYKELRKMPFREAKEEIYIKALKLNPKLEHDFKKIPIGSHKCLKHPLQKEYDILPEDIKRELEKENSLFLSGKLSAKEKTKIIKQAKVFRDLVKEDNQEFITISKGCSCPVVDKVRNVVYKRCKGYGIATTSALIRYHLKKLNIDSIILPRREFWRSGEIKYVDSPPKTTNMMLEESIDNIIYKDLEEIVNIYYSSPVELFNNAVASLARLFCFIEIGDSIWRGLQLGELEIELIKNQSGKYSIETTRHVNPYLKPEYKLYKSICKFDNLPLQVTKDSEGKDRYNFVLVDLDFVRKPDHTTVELLLRMFPKHMQLIVDTIQETNPSLFEGYEPRPILRFDSVVGLGDDISTKEMLINNYRDSKVNTFE